MTTLVPTSQRTLLERQNWQDMRADGRMQDRIESTEEWITRLQALIREERLKNLRPEPGQPVAVIVPLTERLTPDTILAHMGEIMQALQNGSMTAVDAKARLYADQIALSAMRTIDTAKARQQKEARLRKTQTPTAQNPTASASSRKCQKAHPTQKQRKTNDSGKPSPAARKSSGKPKG